MNNTSERWIYLVALVGILWVSAEVRCWRLRHRLSSLWIVAPSIRAVDEASGAVLPIAIGGIPGISSTRDYLPMVSTTFRSDGYSEISVVSDEPLTLQVSSEGYVEQPLTINQASNAAMTVKLRKK